MSSFVLHKIEDVSAIAKIIKNFDKEWLGYTFRQNNYFIHRHTHTVLVTDFDAESWEKISYQENKFTSPKCEFVLEDYNLLVLVQPILNYLKNKHDGQITKTMFVKLSANKKINEHSDAGLYLSTIKRHHIPIITNNDVWFFVDGEKKNLKVGEIWEIDNTKLHKVENLSSTDRVHLIVDILPNVYLGQTLTNLE